MNNTRLIRIIHGPRVVSNVTLPCISLYPSVSTLYGVVCAGAGTRLLQHQQWLAWPLWNHDLAASEARAQPWPGTSQSRSPAPQPPSPGTRTPEHCQHQLGTILRNLTKPSINWKFTANCHISMFLIVEGDTELIQSLSEYKSLNLNIK